MDIDFNILILNKEVVRGKTLLSYNINSKNELTEATYNNICNSNATEFSDITLNKIFKIIKPTDLIKLVLNMNDKERKIIKDIEVIRLLNW